MIEFFALRAKTYAYLINGYNDDHYNKNKIINKKAKGTKKCLIKLELMFENYKILCLMMKSYYNRNKDLKVIIIRCTQKMLIKLR